MVLFPDSSIYNSSDCRTDSVMSKVCQNLKINTAIMLNYAQNYASVIHQGLKETHNSIQSHEQWLPSVYVASFPGFSPVYGMEQR